MFHIFYIFYNGPGYKRGASRRGGLMPAAALRMPVVVKDVGK